MTLPIDRASSSTRLRQRSSTSRAPRVRPFQAELEFTSQERRGEVRRLASDYLINATGPRLNFDATPGLGPDQGHSLSVCAASHAEQAAAMEKVVKTARDGECQRIVVGTGHGTCTWEGAAFEYAFNVDFELRETGVRDQCEVAYLTNEAELGDFGVGGMRFKRNGYATTSQLWTESLFRERDIRAVTGAGVTKVEDGLVTYGTLDGATTPSTSTSPCWPRAPSRGWWPRPSPTSSVARTPRCTPRR